VGFAYQTGQKALSTADVISLCHSRLGFQSSLALCELAS